VFLASTILIVHPTNSLTHLPSDYAQHWLHKANVTAIRRVRKSDNNRIARAVGATVVNRLEDLRESDIGTRCGLFNIEKIGDECVYHTTSFACCIPPLLMLYFISFNVVKVI
jgi:chaperonin GroEL (HSP60 family)